ncbi:hypothetical protein K435DRAFT_873239 [Dendrothele bispora CBS 962.96]|uniref:Uncharacterized protein n=1 Tax=Dendrothele bispora (strain CBS 962.96) TaxID=1314807 RepID=A0A4V4HC19_DENBC|nr:hypothetical protein K435DRAFT_873239 [Dendrothele bispora CBS 962.96]
MAPSRRRLPARKSTGAPAPRRPIGSGDSSHDASPASNSTTRKRKRVSDDRSSQEEEGHGVADVTTIMLYRRLPAIPAAMLFAMAQPDSGACLEIRAKAIANPRWASFKCPACEFKNHREGNGSLFQYTGFYDPEGNGVDNLILSIRNRKFTFFKSTRLEGLAIVQLELDGQNEDLELAFQIATLRAATYTSGVVSVEDVLKHSLRNPPSVSVTRSQPQPLVKAKIVFDFNFPEGIDQHTNKMNDLILALDRMGITQVVFLVVTHADPDSGDLHYAPDGVAAESLPVVMRHLFPSTVRQWLTERSSHLFLLVCGAKPLTQEGYQFMTELVSRRTFNNSFMFPATHLQPGEIANFIAYFVERALYENSPIVS